MPRYLRADELNEGLAAIRQSPQDHGVLKAIVIRPHTNERVSLMQCEISPELGVHGDNWAKGCWLSLPDGRPHPDVQVSIMNARLIGLIAQQEHRWQLAGDNLYLDFDLSRENLAPGQQLAIGSTILEITGESHTGCRKFAERFGRDAVKFVNSAIGKELNLRGTYAKVVQAGTIRVGDMVRNLPGRRSTPHEKLKDCCSGRFKVGNLELGNFQLEWNQ